MTTLTWIRSPTTGAKRDGASINDDNQINDPWFVRFTAPRPDGTHAVLDKYVYVIRAREKRSKQPYDVEVCTMMTVCTDPDDPGSTEVWGDIRYNPLGSALSAVDRALKLSTRNGADKWANQVAGQITRATWDGLTDSERAEKRRERTRGARS